MKPTGKPLKSYQKQAISNNQILQRLSDQNLHIPDPKTAEKSLRSVGYCRLLYYMRSFQKTHNPSTFIDGTCFDDILNLHHFDHDLRDLTFKAISKIEIALRSAIVNTLALQHGPFWYNDQKYYRNISVKNSNKKSFFEMIQEKITRYQDPKKRKGQAINHYYNTYSSPTVPPIRTICEKLTFGELSRFHAALQTEHRNIIAKYIRSIPEPLLTSWFRSLTDLRNVCAHHEPIWNMPLQNNIKKDNRHPNCFKNPKSFYSYAFAIYLLLKDLNEHLWWKEQLIKLLSSCPHPEVEKISHFLKAGSRKKYGSNI